MLVLKQMVATPNNNYPSKDLAQHSEQRHPSVVVAVLVITIPFPERDNEVPFPVSWDDASAPNRVQNCMQQCQFGISTSLEKFNMDATDPSGFTPFHVSTNEGS